MSIKHFVAKKVFWFLDSLSERAVLSSDRVFKLESRILRAFFIPKILVRERAHSGQRNWRRMLVATFQKAISPLFKARVGKVGW